VEANFSPGFFIFRRRIDQWLEPFDHFAQHDIVF
jgi:hypothetical protein